MADFFENISKIQERLTNMSIPTIPDHLIAQSIVPQIPTIEIDEENTFVYQIKHQTSQIIEKSNQQIKLLAEQNERLESNYIKLQELYALKEKELQEAKKDEKKTKIYNRVMMIIAIISMLVAVAAWLFPNMLGGGA